MSAGAEVVHRPGLAPRHDPLYARASELVSRLREAGHEAYLCGGCVRDLLLGAAPKDYDIVTSALPDEVERLFPRTVAVGKAFGVIRVLVGDDAYEVATFRADLEYRDGRRPEGVRWVGAAEDARRRDFTINGLFWDPRDEQVVDWVGGRADLAARVLRAIGDPAARFAEDHLRLLRAVRFACQLGFEVEPATWAALVEKAALLSTVSQERITAELERILCGPDPARGLALLAASGLLDVTLPEVAELAGRRCSWGPASPADLLEHTGLALSRLELPPLELALASLVHELAPESAEGVLDRLRLSGPVRRRASAIRETRAALDAAEPPPVAAAKRLLREETGPLALELLRADHLASDGVLRRELALRLDLERWRKEGSLAPRRLVGGEDLLALGYAPGPLLGRMLAEVEDAQLEGRLVARESVGPWLAERFGRPPGRTEAARESD